MNSSIKRIKAILTKETQDLMKNTNVYVMYFLPVLLTFLWDKVITGMPQGFSLSFGLLFLVVMVGMYVPSMIIAEEKEKKTIEVLLLSPTTPAEVIIGKGLLTFLSIILISIILILMTIGFGSQFPTILFATILISIFSIFIGMIVGFLSPNQMSTGVIGMPIYLLLLLVPQFGMMEGGLMRTIGKALPTYYYFEILIEAIEDNQALLEMPTQLIILCISIIISFILVKYVYQLKGVK